MQLSTPDEVIAQILSFVLNPAACERSVKCMNDDYPNLEAVAQATAFLNALTVSRQWHAVCLRTTQWKTLYKLLNGNHRNHSAGTRTTGFYRVQVFCTVEQERLEAAVHAFIKAKNLTYTSKKAKRKYDTARLGIRKLKKLGKEKLSGKVRDEFVALVKRYEQVHRNYLDGENYQHEEEQKRWDLLRRRQ